MNRTNHPAPFMVDLCLTAAGSDVGVAAQSVIVDRRADPDLDDPVAILKRLVTADQILNPDSEWTPDTHHVVDLWKRDGAVRVLPGASEIVQLDIGDDEDLRGLLADLLRLVEGDPVER